MVRRVREAGCRRPWALPLSRGNPASYLWQTYPALRATPAGAGSYMRLSGTSMAAAVATGVVALVLEANRSANLVAGPALTPNAVKAVLQFTALPVANSGDPEPASDEVAQAPAASMPQARPSCRDGWTRR